MAERGSEEEEERWEGTGRGEGVVPGVHKEGPNPRNLLFVLITATGGRLLFCRRGKNTAIKGQN